MEPRETAYSYILVDCPPSLNLLTINAMAASHAVLVPLQCEFFALEGLSQILSTVERVRAGLNPQLTIHGIVLTMFDGRNKLSGQVVDDVRAHMGDKVYRTVIPRNVRVSEAPSHGKPALLYDLKCAGSQAYLRLAGEIIQREKLLRRGLTDSPEGEDSLSMEPKRRLGRGLDALLGAYPAEPELRVAADGGRRTLPIEFIDRNPRNPRRDFREEDLEELAASLKAHGIVQPIVVRPVAGIDASATRSSPASGAGARRSAPGCTTCRSPSSTSPTARRWSSRSSRTCSAPT